MLEILSVPFAMPLALMCLSISVYKREADSVSKQSQKNSVSKSPKSRLFHKNFCNSLNQSIVSYGSFSSAKRDYDRISQKGLRSQRCRKSAKFHVSRSGPLILPILLVYKFEDFFGLRKLFFYRPPVPTFDYRISCHQEKTMTQNCMLKLCTRTDQRTTRNCGNFGEVLRASAAIQYSLNTN